MKSRKGSDKKIIVLGSGMVGSAIAADLSGTYDVTVADIDFDRTFEIKKKFPQLHISQLDVSDSGLLKSSVINYDLVICAVPGFLGYETIKCIIEAGMNVVDISFSPDDGLELDELAKNSRVTAFIDSGIAPGMDNLFLGYHDARMEVSHFECLVGGLPKVKKWPFFYKAPFSPVDVIEEYTRPVRFVEDGQILICEPLEDSEMIEFKGAGTLEAFLTDGLRSIICTMPHIRYLKERTLRYPGHADLIRALRASGFFSREMINIDGREVTPLKVTGKILMNNWKLKDNDEDITVMRIIIKGKDKSGKRVEIAYDLFDEYSKETGITSMARTTGYTASAVASLFLEGYFSDKGVFPLELIGQHEEIFNYILQYHRERNIYFEKSERTCQE